MQPERRTASVTARSPEQRERALAKANEIRLARARLKRDLAAGTITLARILSDPVGAGNPNRRDG